MNQPAKKLTLYEELMSLPERLTGEILNGQLHAQPRPSGSHGLAESALEYELFGPFHKGRGGPGGWWILVEPEVHFIRDTEVAVPDIAGWKRERMPDIPDDHRFEVVPDWVCEILSPSTASKDREIKMPLYAHYGVSYVWLIDPIKKTLEAYELIDEQWAETGQFKDKASISVKPFEAISFNLNDLWN